MKKREKLKKRFKTFLGILIPIIFVNFLVFTLAFTNPTQSPPDGSPAFPLLSGTLDQVKQGALGIGGIFEAQGLHLDPGEEERPTCNESTRGTFWLEKGGVGEASEVVFCRKVGSEDYVWEDIVTSQSEPPADPITVEYQVSAGADDGIDIGPGFLLNDGNNVAFGIETSDYYAFLRWQNIEIPQGATIQSAKTQVKVYGNNYNYETHEEFKTLIYGIDEDNASAPTDSGDLQGRDLTSASVQRDEVEETGWIDSPDISSIIQEIVDRANWESGNSMMIFERPNVLNLVEDDAFFISRSYEYDSELAAKLIITYTAP